MIKKFFLVFFFSFLVLFFIEFSSRIFFSIFSKSLYSFLYGFNKNILINVEDLSTLNFRVQNLNIKNINYKNKKYQSNKKIIWIFGGSTSAAYCYNGAWSDELQILLPDYKIKNFSTGGGTSGSNLNILLKNKNKQLPKIILWTNRFNEDNVLYLGNPRNKLFLGANNTNYKKNNFTYFLKSFDLTLKKKLVFYFLFNDLIERIDFKINGPKGHKQDIYYNEELKIAVKNYEINTEEAIKFSKENNIDFYIISLFGKYDHNSNSFFTIPLYPVLKNKIVELQKRWNINFIDTENDLILEENVEYFCDNVHQTPIGNKLTAKIIFENIN